MTDPFIPDAKATGRTNSLTRPKKVCRYCPYPTWMYGFLIVLLYASVWSLVKLPDSVEAARSLQVAEHCLIQGQLEDAVSNFEKTLSLVPTSAKARVGMALSLLAQGGEEADRALDYLKNVKLSNSDRTRLQSASPIKYHLYLTARDDS